MRGLLFDLQVWHPEHPPHLFWKPEKHVVGWIFHVHEICLINFLPYLPPNIPGLKAKGGIYTQYNTWIHTFKYCDSTAIHCVHHVAISQGSAFWVIRWLGQPSPFSHGIPQVFPSFKPGQCVILSYLIFQEIFPWPGPFLYCTASGPTPWCFSNMFLNFSLRENCSCLHDLLAWSFPWPS